ncbi:uncharacterized protein si:ch211-13c6.2 isoform X1 [Gymnodraco acuticeps]|uniref:Uncharacterized protein si:ch211-13c6.2 isoform X1 n=2 Tax=Gymnodraco acuticeps TaxID=8218 RepID=A0A6P8XAD2_GYMAC|nr:uncharacterized protein si:ch211-13c6.2 isoform X1 [Gymnodraco acuticeps]
MDHFETPYEEEANFIECKVCEKSIRGDTLYKIHLTVPTHIKKEDDLIASGLAIRRNFVPVFEDIFQFLDYLKLDEAIIGLDYLEELSWSDPQSGPRYSCTLCSHQISHLQVIVLHVIGRKHRLKYMETKRPELLTRNKQFTLTQSGKAIRARAEIIERQDGRGTPVIVGKKGMERKLNISRVPQRQEHNRDQTTSQSSMQLDVPTHRPGLKDHPDSHTQRPPAGYSNSPPFHPGDPHISNRDRPMYQEEYSLRHGRMDEELQRADYRQSEMHRREYLDPDFCAEYENTYVEDPPRRGAPEPVGGLRYDSMEQMPHHQNVEHYAEEPPPYRRNPQEKDQLKEFYTDEVRHSQGHAEYQPLQQVYQEGHEQRRSLERESCGNNDMNRAGREGSWEPETKRRVQPTPMESGQSHDHLFNTIIDYCHEMGEPHQVQAGGHSRTGPDTSQRGDEAVVAFSEIPEPFKRFLAGVANDEGHNRRKRKSRFTDATAEELETTNEMFNDEYRPPNPKFGGHPRHVRPEIHQHPDSIESQSLQYTEGYQRGGPESSNVFDMMKNIEIENAEEAHFLKNKLCDLLKDFKNKKSAKVVQNSQGRGSISQDYNSLSPGRELSPRHQYETTFREDSDRRRPDDLFFQEDHRGRDWQQHELIPDVRTQEYHHPVRREPRRSNRSRYEEVFGLPGQSRTLPATHPDEPARYPERFQEPMNPHDYLPAGQKFLDPYNSAPPLHMEREPRMDRGPRYSNSLDKITSTLLELVARK